jgi:hypothetical protein
MYRKLTHVEHILARPDSYVGSLARETTETWVDFNRTNVSVSPGLVKIFDEVLVNAIDQHSLNPKKTTRIDVTFQGDVFSVRNNGDGIPNGVHAETGVRLPELIFGHLLTSSNYDDTQERTTGGRNGYGAKLTNVYSSKFTVRILHKNQKYTQKWSKNMTEVPRVPEWNTPRGEEPRGLCSYALWRCTSGDARWRHCRRPLDDWFISAHFVCEWYLDDSGWHARRPVCESARAQVGDWYSTGTNQGVPVCDDARNDHQPDIFKSDQDGVYIQGDH